MKTKNLLLTFLLLLAVQIGWGQTQIYLVDFESAAGYSTTPAEFSDGGTDYFTSTFNNTIGSAVSVSNIQGTHFFGAQDIDADQSTVPCFINIDDVNISGYTNLEFRVYLAEDDDGGNQDWDAADFVHFDYDIDNTGSFSDLLWIESSGGTNTAPFIDTDFDGTGDGTEITSTFVQFTQNITGTGLLLDLKITIDLTAGDEDIAIDHIEIYGTSSSTNDTDSEVSASGTLSEPATIASTIDADGEEIMVFDFTFTDAGTADGLATILDEIQITQGDNNQVADWTDAIAGVYLSGTDLATDLAGTVNSTNITFASNDMISIADGTNETYTLKIYLNTDLSGITDNDILEFALNYADITTDPTGSSFGSGAPESGNANVAISIVASELNFIQEPTDTEVNIAMSPDPTVAATDANGNFDIDYSDAITVTSDGTMTGDPVSGSWSNGVATFSGLTHTVVETTRTLTAESGTLTDGTSTNFDITDASSFCGSETFTNSNLTGSYSTNNYIGDNGVTWYYIESRDESTYGINGAGIMLRRSSDNSKVYSSSEPGGIGDFSCNLRKAFTGAGNRQVELFVNGISQGTSIAWDNTDVQSFSVSGINISGNVVVEIRNITGNQVIVDDIEWSCYSSTPTIDLTGTDPNPDDFTKGSNNNIIYRIEASTTVEDQDITQIDFRIDAAADNLDILVSNYKLYYSTDATLDGGDTQIEDETTIASATFQTVSFTGFTQTITAGSTGYFFITTDVLATATSGELLQVDNSNVSVTYTTNSSPTVSETYNAANVHEILDTHSDIIAVAGSESDFVSSIENTAGPLNSTQGVQVWQFTIRDGGTANDDDALATIVTDLIISQNAGNAMGDWGDAILSCDLFNGTTHIDQATVTANQIQFSGSPLVNVPDNGEVTLTMRLSIQTSPDNNTPGTNKDGDDFVFTISSSNVTADPAGSQFGSFSAANSENGKNEFQVVATTLAFVQQPSDVGVNATMLPNVTVEGYDVNGNKDLKGTTISITSDGTMTSSPKTAGIINGLATYTDIVHTVVQTNRTLTASAPGATPVSSDLFDILDVTTFEPGQFVIIGFDARVSSGSNDAIYLMNFVDIKEGTKFLWINSRFEAGAAANERTLHWGGSGDEPYNDPSYLEIQWASNGQGVIPAGSVISFETSGTNLVSPRINGSVTSDLVLLSSDGSANVSSSEGDQVWLAQGYFTGYGTVGVDRYSLLTGNVFFGLTSINAWVPITSACSDDNSSTNSNRESRTHPDLTCFNIELLSGDDYIYYQNGTGGVPGDPIHTGTKREVLLGIQSAVNWYGNSGTADLDIDEEFILSTETPTNPTSIGKRFNFTASGNTDGTWVGGSTGNETDWFYCGNWEGLVVPDDQTDVLITDVVAGNEPDIDCQLTNPDAANFDYIATCRNLTITDEILTINGYNTDTLKAHGDIVINGTGSINMDDGDAGTDDGVIVAYRNYYNYNSPISYGNGTIILEGAVEQEFQETQLYNLIVRNSSATGILLFFDVVVNNNLLQNSGHIYFDGNDFTISGKYDRKTGKFSGFNTSNLLINGSGSLDSIYFTNDFNLNNFTMNRAGDTATLMTDLTVLNNLTISDGTVTLTPTNNYDANTLLNSVGTSGLLIESNSAGTASLIHNSTPNTNANATYQRYMTANQWHYVFSPLNDVDETDLSLTSDGLTNPNFYWYDEDVADYWQGTTLYNPTGWTSVSDPKLSVENGYIHYGYESRIFELDGGNLFDDDKVFTLSYSNSGSGNEPITGTDWDNFEGWNLVGNPYPSALDWDAIPAGNKSNIANFIYYYDGVAEKYLCYGGNPPWDNDGISINGGTQYIPVNQAFFVKALSTADGSNLTLSNAARVHDAQPFYKNSSENILRINIQKDDYTDETVLRISDLSTDNYDEQYDAIKMFAWNGTKPQVFTLNNDFSSKYVINTIAPVTNNKTVPLGVYVGFAGEYSLNFTELNFNEDLNVYLEDTKTGSFVRIYTNYSHKFIEDAGTINDRFILHFRENNSPIVMYEIPDQYTETNTNWNFRIPDDLFTDSDYEDYLTYNGRIYGGTCPPDWFEFNNGTFYVNCPYPTRVPLEIIATDTHGAEASTYFWLNIEGDIPTDINETSTEVFIYPNPTNGYLFVELSKISETATINLITVDGKTIQSFTPTDISTKIDLSGFAKGTYIIEIINNNSSIREKIILE